MGYRIVRGLIKVVEMCFLILLALILLAMLAGLGTGELAITFFILAVGVAFTRMCIDSLNRIIGK